MATDNTTATPEPRRLDDVINLHGHAPADGHGDNQGAEKLLLLADPDGDMLGIIHGIHGTVKTLNESEFFNGIYSASSDTAETAEIAQNLIWGLMYLTKRLYSAAGAVPYDLEERVKLALADSQGGVA